jgi:protein phosphatase
MFLAELEASVWKSHEVLRAQGDREYEGRGGATTLTMVAVLWPRAYLVQVGDSRCYRLRGGRLERISQDQTVTQQLVESGALTQSQARKSPLRGVLASALGGKEATPVTMADEARWEDVMLLCSDGLTRHVPDEEIEQELRSLQSSEATCRRLVDLALERGGEDNVTVIISRLRPRTPVAT